MFDRITKLLLVILITLLVLLMMITFGVVTVKAKTNVSDFIPKCDYLGYQRITTYCPACNDGAGHESSSGKYLEYGDAACNWLPLGTKINIEGEEFTVVDTCGTDAIDIFIDDDSGCCFCDRNEYRKVCVQYE